MPRTPGISAEPVAPAPPAVVPLNIEGRRWRGPKTCLELFDNGDAEISVHSGKHPKTLVMGRATVDSASPEEFSVSLSATRIWKGRHSRPCRKVHELGRFAEKVTVLGTHVAGDQDATFTMKKVADDAWEMCGATCEILKPDAPLLGAHWRRPNADDTKYRSPYAGGDHHATPMDNGWAPGELLELKLIENRQHLWFGGSDRTVVEVAATMQVRPTTSDLFQIEVTAAESSSLGEGAVLGLIVVPKETVTLHARRLANQQLEVCGKPKHCQVLDRVFDSFSYSLR